MSVSNNAKSESIADPNTSAAEYSEDLNVVERLHSALKLTCEKFVSSVKFSSFKKKYKVIYDENPVELKNFYDQLTSQMRKNMLEDIDELCADYSIDFLLTSLAKINESQHTQCSWRPSGNPEEDLRDHIYPLKQQHKAALENVLNKLIINNDELRNSAADNHAEIMHMKNCNDDLYGKFNNIITSFNAEIVKNVMANMEEYLEESE